MHLPSDAERLWFAHLLESGRLAPSALTVTPQRIHALLARSETLDTFLAAKFPSLKRYALEGAESMLPALEALFACAARAGLSNIILAMPHRGRLNLLVGLLGYDPRALFWKVRGGGEVELGLGAGDMGGDVDFGEGEEGGIKVSLQPNPSHLEAINPVALGKTRAKQFALLRAGGADTTPTSGSASIPCTPGDRVLALQLHGDAAFAGQGVVMETLGLGGLPRYTVGGSVHLVVNNNIGYTTPTSAARSSLYCTDAGKMVGCPVLHVNGDYPEDVVRAVEVAFEWRDLFRKDIIIDLVVYRRWGHNELDEPAYTQPRMYAHIRARRSVGGVYEDRLVESGVITREAATAVRAEYRAFLETQLAQAGASTPPNFTNASTIPPTWSSLVWPGSPRAVRAPETGVCADVLVRAGRASVVYPGSELIHPRLQRHVKHRLERISRGEGIDWATAEAMAFGTLMLDGCDVRIAGQDVGRGTFSQRHAMLVDQRTEAVVVPLNYGLAEAEGRLEIANSSLSEMAVLGFEYGMSWERPNLLAIWEAQFGDFFNGAQVIIDNFIASAETKWLKQSGIVLLLPHGLDGAGPEHSSARLERFLQLSNDRYTYNPHSDKDTHHVNLHVAFPTTPAQYFHLLRRQIKRNFRKPLVVAAPKGLLRLAAATSSLADLKPGTSFQPVLDDPSIADADAHKVERVVLLTGKLYYDLVKERTTRQMCDRVSLLRIEELSPFPFAALHTALARYPNAQEWVWVQEEPRNQGAWGHVGGRVGEVLRGLVGKRVELVYRGRKEDAVCATGIGSVYQAQQRAVIEAAFVGM
ncbi:thiamine diphosphate-binding protein [Hygrophoropsis aurantiaca]|uniref:Thiamine diphosphate-binding protein n=1 Tax=Hygrophoropsis aurantiaca TaxID=72124 RepID=A0ACB7ZW81_9AGAM|nr:thiamine diphosphate-binding protein [Hygrophoropsis aurantiaca]